jgi:hypothetical protein
MTPRPLDIPPATDGDRRHTERCSIHRAACETCGAAEQPRRSAVISPAAEWMRPAAAARAFGLSEKTLRGWVKDGKVSRSKIGGCVFWSARDIENLIAANAEPRTVIPIAPRQAAPAARNDDWRDDPFWKGAAR